VVDVMTPSSLGPVAVDAVADPGAGDEATLRITSKANRRIAIRMTSSSTNSATRSKTCSGASKTGRRIHTRYDRCADTYFSAICIAAAVIFWL
jgi:putative transposase